MAEIKRIISILEASGASTANIEKRLIHIEELVKNASKLPSVPSSAKRSRGGRTKELKDDNAHDPLEDVEFGSPVTVLGETVEFDKYKNLIVPFACHVASTHTGAGIVHFLPSSLEPGQVVINLFSILAAGAAFPSGALSLDSSVTVFKSFLLDTFPNVFKKTTKADAVPVISTTLFRPSLDSSVRNVLSVSLANLMQLLADVFQIETEQEREFTVYGPFPNDQQLLNVANSHFLTAFTNRVDSYNKKSDTKMNSIHEFVLNAIRNSPSTAFKPQLMPFMYEKGLISVGWPVQRELSCSIFPSLMKASSALLKKTPLAPVKEGSLMAQTLTAMKVWQEEKFGGPGYHVSVQMLRLEGKEEKVYFAILPDIQFCPPMGFDEQVARIGQMSHNTQCVATSLGFEQGKPYPGPAFKAVAPAPAAPKPPVAASDAIETPIAKASSKDTKKKASKKEKEESESDGNVSEEMEFVKKVKKASASKVFIFLIL